MLITEDKRDSDAPLADVGAVIKRSPNQNSIDFEGRARWGEEII